MRSALFSSALHCPVLRSAVVLFIVATPTASGSDTDNIAAAVKKGMDRLIADQKGDGSWDYADPKNAEDRKLGMTSLAALALHENGMLPTDPPLAKALRYVRQKSATNPDTYAVSCATLFLARLNERQDRELIRTLAYKLMAGQGITGCWHYDVPKSIDAAAAPPVAGGKELGDMSVTQFAVFALWQAHSAGVNLGGTLVRTKARLAWAQTKTGGFNYSAIPDHPFHVSAPESPPGGSLDSASMTTAGAFIWVVAVAYDVSEAKKKGSSSTRSGAITTGNPMYDALQKGAPGRKSELGAHGGAGTAEGQLEYRFPIVLPPNIEVSSSDPLAQDKALARAMERVDYWAKSMTGRGSAYYLWTLQRLGVLLGRETFGDVDWYRAGAAALLARQQADGSWSGSGTVYQTGPETCFSLLFLSRVNMGSEIPRLLNRNPPAPYLVAGKDSAPFKTLAEALQNCKDGDTIFVTGYGPYALQPTTIDKSVSIRPAVGADPIFTYRISAPGKPALTFKADNIVLEGLRFQMDTPAGRDFAARAADQGREGTFTLFSCVGKNLRLLNCSLTAVGRAPTTAFELRSGKLLGRNVIVAGFNSAVYRPGTGDVAYALFKDSIFYGNKGFEVAGEKEFNCWVFESSATNNDFFDFDRMTGPFAVTVENAAIKASKLIARIGAKGDGDRTWSGQMNLYDVGAFAPEGDDKLKQVGDLDDWRKAWETTEESSKTGTAPFEPQRKQVGSMRHDISANEWAMDPTFVSRLIRARGKLSVGAAVHLVGAGTPYIYFSRSEDYTDWHKVKPPSER